MSKSIGNVVLVKDVEEKLALRFFLLSTHYRSPLNYDEEVFAMYVKEWQKLENAYKTLFYKLDLVKELDLNIEIKDIEIKNEINNFDLAMEDDFNTANAITALQSLLRLINSNLRKKLVFTKLNELLKALNYMVDILGLKVEVTPLTDEDRSVYESWQKARNDKDFSLADDLREKLTRRGML